MDNDKGYEILTLRYVFEFIDYNGNTMNVIEIDSKTDNIQDIIQDVFEISRRVFNLETSDDFDIVFKSVRLITRSPILVR
ncbi:hypothetical protein LCGC14_2291960 [marine sediment metagenome]|uniref:Uncharacterized protein n=1 Tax=marine sediment metagenome TaxID=412755 RepID=A0A0F9DDM5_9ZZZZ